MCGRLRAEAAIKTLEEERRQWWRSGRESGSGGVQDSLSEPEGGVLSLPASLSHILDLTSILVSELGFVASSSQTKINLLGFLLPLTTETVAHLSWDL